MIAALALMLTPQAEVVAAGIIFHCSGGAVFDVFVPMDSKQADYDTDALGFRRGASQNGSPVAKFELIRDELPQRLTLTWRREHNSPVRLTISNYKDGVASYTLSTERNPASRLFTPVTITGTCRAGDLGEGS
jgi:hypothetical protein